MTIYILRKQLTNKNITVLTISFILYFYSESWRNGHINLLTLNNV